MSSDVKGATSFEVTIGGTTFKQSESKGLESLVFEDHIDMVNILTVRIGGAEEQPEWNFNIGDEVKLKLGEGRQVFEGEVVSMEPSYQVEGVSSVSIRCLDKMHRLGRGRKTRFWEKKKDSDVVSEVGAECGLSVSADATEETHEYILQRNETNIAFIKRLAARNNYTASVKEGKLEFKKASFQGSAIDVKMGENLRSMRMSFNSMDQVQKVVVRGWDITKKEEIVGQASLGDITAIGGGSKGAEVSSKFGDATAYITDVPVSTQSQANQVAKAELERLARQFCHGSCSIKGNDTVMAGSTVNFSGVNKNGNGKFFVLGTRHIVSNRSGYTTEIMFCSNTLGT
jgi:phage protein D